ncbi:sialate O-acetylesterase [Sphingomonas sp. ST-64]|uniref:Sialate O-acetylesterase n=2 Tax=Sphingomonas plantiphila TaxID=3163295 RepID=A0ABW8YKY9_9SPHN
MAAAQTRDAGSPPAAERVGTDSLFASHMVLQRDRPIRIWGRALPGEAVRLSLGKAQARAITRPDGTWTVTLPARPAGGPYRLDVSAPSFRDRYREILIGDVWLCAGQSNMEFRRSKAVDLPAHFAPDAGLRMLDIARREAPTPSPHLMTLAGWKTSTPDSAARFSAICHHFGERLRAQLGVPIGLVGASWGGTRIAAFVDAVTLKTRGLDGTAHDPVSRQNDGRVFNAMIAPLAPSGLKGVLWYQGESDTHRPEGYAPRLAALAASWRQAFAQPLPMIVVQLPPFNPSPRTPPGHWAEIREAQRRFVSDDGSAGLVVQIDQESANDLHPAKKAVVAERAAERALSVAYGHGSSRSGAEPPRIVRIGRRLLLNYEIPDRLVAPNPEAVRGFEICTDTCAAIQARLTGPRRIELTISDSTVPRCLRYAWADVPQQNLQTERSGPPGPFAISLREDTTVADPGVAPTTDHRKIEVRAAVSKCNLFHSGMCGSEVTASDTRPSARGPIAAMLVC